MSQQKWLEQWLARHGAPAGTVHVKRSGQLELSASVNIPKSVLEKTATIPRGKGMAGLAWERDRIVSTCNLETDETGDVRPGAKAVNAHAALAIPVHDAAGELRAVVGIAFMDERDFTDDELQAFMQAAEDLPEVG